MRGVIPSVKNRFRYCRPTSLATILLLLLQTPLGFCETKQVAMPTPISRTISISTGEFPPWTGSALPHDGYVNHIIKAAFASQGVTVDFVYQPWKRAFEEARQGKFDATSYWYESAERRESMLFSDLVITNRTVFFQRRDEAEVHWKTLSDLSQYRMSATLGFTYTDDFYRAIDSKVISPIMVP